MYTNMTCRCRSEGTGYMLHQHAQVALPPNTMPGSGKQWPVTHSWLVAGQSTPHAHACYSQANSAALDNMQKGNWSLIAPQSRCRPAAAGTGAARWRPGTRGWGQTVCCPQSAASSAWQGLAKESLQMMPIQMTRHQQRVGCKSAASFAQRLMNAVRCAVEIRQQRCTADPQSSLTERPSSGGQGCNSTV